MVRLLRGAALLLLSAPLYAQLPFNQIAVFGDSLSDNGNLYYGTSLLGLPTPGPPQYATGEYTDGANSVPSTKAPLGLWIEQLAASLSLPVPQPFSKGGLNYAVASAQTGSNPAYSPSLLSIPWSTDQVGIFLKSTPAAPANYLYAFWCGANDVLNGASATAAAANVQANINSLANAGARYFLWVNLPPLGEVPESIGTSQRAALDAASVTYNNAMTAAIAQLTAAHPGIVIATFDAYGLFLSILQNPPLYGFVNVTASAQGLTAVNPNTYLFWDGLHPTTAGHADVALGVSSAIGAAFEGHPAITSVVNAEDAIATIAPNTWVAVKGVLLSPAGDMRTWTAADIVNGQMPQSLDGVSVTFNNEKGYVYYISPTQVNVLTPPDLAPGPVNVQLSVKSLSSGTFAVQSQALAPAFFVFDGTHVAATHADGAYLGPANLYPAVTTPAAAGETVVLYANGFGPTSTPVTAGASTQSGTLSPLPVVTIGGIQATVVYAGLQGAGLYQFNVTVPLGTPSGDIPLTATFGGSSTQAGVVIAVK